MTRTLQLTLAAHGVSRTVSIALGIVLFGLAWVGVGNATERCAVVIGNRDYQNLPKIERANKDATRVAAALADIGFAVERLDDVGTSTFSAAFEEACKGTSALVFAYYAGQGLQLNGESYLVPVDARPGAAGSFTTVSLTAAVKALAGDAKRPVAFVFDASRSTEIAGATGAVVPAQATSPPMDFDSPVALSWATQPGGTADGSFYANVFAEAIKAPNASVPDLFDVLRKQVTAASGGKQTPWTSSSFPSPIMMVKP